MSAPSIRHGLKAVASTVNYAVIKQDSLKPSLIAQKNLGPTSTPQPRSFEFSRNPPKTDTSQQVTYRTAAGVLKKVELRNNALKTTFVTRNAIGTMTYTPQQRSWSVGSPPKSTDLSGRL